MKTPQADQPEVRVLKTGSCPSLSGKSKLAYEIGCDSASAIHVRISKNSGTGYYSKAWIGWAELLKVLDKNGGKPITGFTFHPLFLHRSVNTAGFLLSALKQEGLLAPMASNRRAHECRDATGFLAEIAVLMSSPKPASKGAKAVKAVAAKKPPTKARPSGA